jgi:hypothetical protein
MHFTNFSLDTMLEPTTLRLLIADGTKEGEENLIHNFYRSAISHSECTLEELPPQWPRILTYYSQMAEESLLHKLASRLRANDPPKEIDFSYQALLSTQEAISLLSHYKLVLPDSLRVLVHTIYLSGVQSGEVGGASFLDLPGLIWMRPSIDWTIYLYAESLLHELLHQAVNLYDGTIGLISDLGHKEQVAIPSAIRKIYPSGQQSMRPFWGAFHAAVVTWWLILFFKMIGDYEKAQVFTASLRASLPALLLQPIFLTSTGNELLIEMMDRLVII